MTADHISIGVHEIAEEMKLPLIQGTAHLQSGHNLNRPFNTESVQATDPSHRVMIRQGDDIQPNRFTAGEDLLGRKGPIGSR
jgi:hypothetical protein